MDEKDVKALLGDIKYLAEHGEKNDVIAMCENEIEEIEKRTIKQDVIDLVRIIEDARYELTKLKEKDAEKIYEMLNKASKKLRNLANKKELNTTTTNENV